MTEAPRVMATDVHSPELFPNPGYGMFCPYQPVTAVGTAMIATSRQRTRQLLIENGEPLRLAGAAAAPNSKRRPGA